ncbi:MAG: hypothetical protein ABIA78_04130 [archaeon]
MEEKDKRIRLEDLNLGVETMKMEPIDKGIVRYLKRLDKKYDKVVREGEKYLKDCELRY